MMQAVGHHAMAAGQCVQLEPLLCNPTWLEHKLHAYGVTSIVADFRRCRAACLSRPTDNKANAAQLGLATCAVKSKFPLCSTCSAGGTSARLPMPISGFRQAFAQVRALLPELS